MRNGIPLVVATFAVALAIIVGNRLSNEAMAVVVGAVCGISASVPIAIIAAMAASTGGMRHNQQTTEFEPTYETHRPYVSPAPQLPPSTINIYITPASVREQQAIENGWVQILPAVKQIHSRISQ